MCLGRRFPIRRLISPPVPPLNTLVAEQSEHCVSPPTDQSDKNIVADHRRNTPPPIPPPKHQFVVNNFIVVITARAFTNTLVFRHSAPTAINKNISPFPLCSLLDRYNYYCCSWRRTHYEEGKRGGINATGRIPFSHWSYAAMDSALLDASL